MKRTNKRKGKKKENKTKLYIKHENGYTEVDITAVGD